MWRAGAGRRPGKVLECFVPCGARQAVGDGASNQSNTAQVNGSEFTAVSQGNANTAISSAPLWW
ncbi:hypothetical protein C1J00_42525 [Streptomyces cahuitamycinicus]|uniref:Uncharacterized protein n=1 Tax=Streptomyces cahuitamycinicus TaxID=2070367 RepID=A0A2N8TBD1_9ACTN|nr:hypothetical protein C1J00_42525 [Streptomyces cahuitamycinicus]